MFDRKLWNSLPPSPHLKFIKCFDTRKFVKRRCVPLRCFSVLWDKMFSIENRDIPLLGIYFFRCRKLLTNKRVSYEIFQHIETIELLIENRDTAFLHTPPPLKSIKLFDTRSFVAQRMVSLRKFSVLWLNKFPIEKRDIPPLGINFFVSEIINALRVHLRSFPVLRDKKFRQKIVTLPSWAENFSIPKISDTLKGSPTKIIGTEWPRFLTENRETPSSPSILFIKFFVDETRHRGVPLRSFSELWDNKFSIENRDFPSQA